MNLSLTPLPGMPLIQPGTDLEAEILRGLENAAIELADGDILIAAQKIVSKSEGRLVDLVAIQPGAKAVALAAETGKDPRLVELILRESLTVLRSRPGLIIVEHRLGFVCANAGIDHSNVAGSDEWVLLLPENPDRSAEKLRVQLETASGVSLGVMIIDSHGRPFRNGIVGAAIGLSGLPGLVDLRGQFDLLGRELQVTQVAAADELAAAASLVMGQAAEGTPVVHARGFPYPLREAALGELIRSRDQDLFR